MFVNGGVHVNDNFVVGDLVNPSSCGTPTWAALGAGGWKNSHAGIGTVMGWFDVEEGESYDIRMYVFSQSNNKAGPIAWSGTVRLNDLSSDAVVEFTEYQTSE